MRDAALALKHVNPALRLSAYPAIAARLLVHDHPRQLFGRDAALTLYDVTESHRGDRGRSMLNRTALGEIDLAIAPSGSNRTDSAIELAETVLYDWTMQVVLPRDVNGALRDRKRIRVGAIADLNIVCTPDGHRSRELLEQAFADEGLKLEPYAEHSNQDVLRQLAQQRTGQRSSQLTVCVRAFVRSGRGAAYPRHATAVARRTRTASRAERPVSVGRVSSGTRRSLHRLRDPRAHGPCDSLGEVDVRLELARPLEEFGDGAEAAVWHGGFDGEALAGAEQALSVYAHLFDRARARPAG
jgi:hypothetical protein